MVRRRGARFDVDLDELHPVARLDLALEHGRERVTRAAPSAQKSTTTGTSCERWMTSVLKVSSVDVHASLTSA